MDIEMTRENSKAKKPVTYNSSKAICNLVFIGIAVLVGCVVFGIFITQAIGWLIEWLIGFMPEEIKPELHFSDFLGGAIGLTVGFIFDKICIDRINCVYSFRRFMSALCHELDNIQCKKDGKSHIYIERAGVKEEVTFSDSGEVSNKNLSKCTEVFNIVKELILDNIVTSAETMSLISNLPFASDFKYRFTDFLGRVHRRISEYNKSVGEVESKESKTGIVEEKDCKLILIERQKINKEIDNFESDEKFHKLTVKW